MQLKHNVFAGAKRAVLSSEYCLPIDIARKESDPLSKYGNKNAPMKLDLTMLPASQIGQHKSPVHEI